MPPLELEALKAGESMEAGQGGAEVGGGNPEKTLLKGNKLWA